jgi:type II secretory ATPase GspE/PulE/Tfp pilus assembly ATPase PilB-like protein
MDFQADSDGIMEDEVHGETQEAVGPSDWRADDSSIVRAVNMIISQAIKTGASHIHLEAALRQTSGMVLVTGPKGSGTKSTLYSFLRSLTGSDACILTAENPIEYDFDGVGQVQLKEQLGYTYAAALSSYILQNPDVVMLQELREPEVAKAAVQTALDCCLILSSLASVDAADALARLQEMGVQPVLLASAIRLVVSQRGIRKLCRNCRTPYTPPSDLLERAGVLNSIFEEGRNEAV